jgi:hypothetical protein
MNQQQMYSFVKRKLTFAIAKNAFADAASRMLTFKHEPKPAYPSTFSILD